jgi:hypothetical protein
MTSRVLSVALLGLVLAALSSARSPDSTLAAQNATAQPPTGRSGLAAPGAKLQKLATDFTFTDRVRYGKKPAR